MADETIMIVEDNEILRNGIKLLLEADGFEVISASDGKSALDQMQYILPDLILSDIAMPEMDGYAFFEAVRARPEWLSIPFIFLTARGGREDIFTGKRLGAEDYLIKPVSHQELLSTIHSRLARNQQLLLAKLQEAYEYSLIMLANAVELRDRYTRGHVERVRDFSLAIAAHMDLTPYQIKAVELGSILHDVGKIHIREAILQKAGPLTEAEWEEMKLHPILGSDLLQNIPYLAPAIPIIRHHHERWNGTGYPDGLAGEAIPLEARIVSVADSLDAMIVSRVYKSARLPGGAFHEIIQSSGVRYDPVVVAAFTKAWTEIEVLMNASSDPATSKPQSDSKL